MNNGSSHKLNGHNNTLTPEAINVVRLKEFKDAPDNENQLPLLVDEIKSRQHRIKNDLRVIGGLLVESKELVGHGEFEKFVEDNFDFSISTARNLMNVFIQCGAYPEIFDQINSTVLYQISAPNFPDELRKFMLNNTKLLDNINNKKVADIGKRFAKGEIDIESNEVQSLLKYSRKNDAIKFYQNEVENLIKSISEHHKLLGKFIDNIDWPIHPDKNKTILTKKQKKMIDKLASEIGAMGMILFPDAGTDIETEKSN